MGNTHHVINEALCHLVCRQPSSLSSNLKARLFLPLRWGGSYVEELAMSVV